MPQLKELTVETITDFIQTQVREAGASGVVIGLSGGIDSAVVTKLCVDALGGDKVLNVFMPSPSTPTQDLRDVQGMSRAWGTTLLVYDIEQLLRTYHKIMPGSQSKEVSGNLIARIRMTILYAHANMEGRLVMGTGNKSELLMGYFTKYGDGGADLMPIGDLYKTEVRELARVIGVPEGIIAKEPSAGLWEGQTDESEMGIAYDDLDRVLSGLEDQLPLDVISKRSGVPMELVRMVATKNATSVHKRRLALIPKLGGRTIGCDWRE
ncbi:MAG TPA: NAD+ synthase [Methanomassiliicoccales archaeon]|jgi:NAD+ synthase|nr:NAD+ synthase [Methanomassiliicoccales archaeon]HPD08710.1 NAD+ synthase [Methanomassiliicoccales archaeon]HRR67390.1 NAD+ synthase [Methanomassiliicoccales archaeon]